MKKVKVIWREHELVSYGYEEEFEVADDFEITKDSCFNLVKNWRETDSRSFDTSWTDYQDIDQEIYPVTIDDVMEIIPPSIEEKKNEYQDEIERLSFIVSDTLAEKERIEKLLTELK